MRRLCLALAFLLVVSSEAHAQWPLSVSKLGAPAPPTSWIATGMACHQALIVSRRGTFIFNRSECGATYEPQARITICCLIAGSGRTAKFLEAKTATQDLLVLRQHTVAEAAPK